MARQPFIEQSNRTTVIGIIAVVVIVALVAGFLRTQHIDWFSTPSQGLTGLVTAETFEGVRAVELQSYKVHQTKLLDPELRTFTAYVDGADSIISVKRGDREYIAPLEMDIDGIYYGVFFEGDAEVMVVLNTWTDTLTVKDLLPQTLLLKTVPMTLYEGSLSLPNQQLDVQYILGNDALQITTPDGVESVKLSAGGIGTWSTAEGEHRVDLDLDDSTVTFYDLY